MSHNRTSSRLAVALLALTCCAAAQETRSQTVTPPSSQSSSEDTNAKQRVRPAPPLAPSTDSRRFIFSIDEFDNGRKLNSRSFEILARDGFQQSSMKAGSRLPVPMRSSSTTENNPAEWQYIDVGLNVQCHYELRQDGALDLTTNIDMSNVASNATPGTTSGPVIRQTKFDTSSVVHPDTPTLLSSIEDLNSGHTYELHVIAKTSR